jgi:hypothetical protein
MHEVLAQLDEPEREALVVKYLALEASQPEPTTSRDGYLFVHNLVDRKGRLTDDGLELARFLEQSGDFAHLASAAPSVATPPPLDLIAEVRALAKRAGGLAMLRALVNSLTE